MGIVGRFVTVGVPDPAAGDLSSPPVSTIAATMPPAMSTTAMTAAMIALRLFLRGGWPYGGAPGGPPGPVGPPGPPGPGP